jgi:hypothetical protein
VIELTITPALLAGLATVITAVAALVWALRKDPTNTGK